MRYGPARLMADLDALGYGVQRVDASDGTPFVIIPDYVVPCGRFAGRTIDLGLQATPDFPRSVASAIHVRSNPHLFDYGDTEPRKRNITKSALGPEWRYWSRNFGWNGEKSARRLMSQINRIFADA